MLVQLPWRSAGLVVDCCTGCPTSGMDRISNFELTSYMKSVGSMSKFMKEKY